MQSGDLLGQMPRKPRHLLRLRLLNGALQLLKMSLRFIKCAEPPQVASYLVPLADLKKQGWDMLTDDIAIRSGQLVA